MRSAIRELGFRSPLDVLRAIRNFAITVWDPTRSDIQHGITTLVQRDLAEAPPEQSRELAAQQPALAALYEEGYDPDITPERLERLPDGTLGREYARFIRANDIHPLQTLLAIGPARNLLAYQAKRAYKLHDLMHVVLGTDASVIGEVRIVAYSLGQARKASARAPAMAFAVLVMNIALRRPHEMREAVRLAAQWLEVGERAPWHVIARVEDYLEKPVEEVRAVLLPALAREAA